MSQQTDLKRFPVCVVTRLITFWAVCSFIGRQKDVALTANVYAAVQPQHFGACGLGNFFICLPKIGCLITEVLAKNLDNLITRGITAFELML